MQNIIRMDTSVTYVNRNSERSLVLEPNSINKNDKKKNKLHVLAIRGNAIFRQMVHIKHTTSLGGNPPPQMGTSGKE